MNFFKVYKYLDNIHCPRKKYLHDNISFFYDLFITLM